MRTTEFFSSDRLLYRPYKIEDLYNLFKFRNEESRRRWFYFQEPDILTEKTAIKHIQENIELWSREVDILKEEAGFAIALKETDELIGFVGAGKCRCDDVEIGEVFQNKGYATEAVKTIIEWCFNKLREQNAELKIVCKIEHENWPSRKVAEKAGFAFSHKEQYVTVYEIKG